MNIVIIGATSEIAKEVGRIYAAKKDNFLLIGRDSSKLEQLKSDILSRGASAATTYMADFDNKDSYQALFEASRSAFKQIDLLIVAHGILPDQLAIENDFTKIESNARTNFLSYISILSLFAKTFEDQKYGSIAVFSSVSGDRCRRNSYIYGSFKAGVQAFLEGYTARLSRANVHVLDIRAGLVDTPMTKHMKKGVLCSTADKVARDIAKAITKKKQVLYTPFFWRYIMFSIRMIPNVIFNKLNI